jgi:hypothetical protein
LALQVALLPTVGAEGERRRKQLRSTHLSGCARGGAWWRRAVTVPAVLEVFLCNS